MNEQSVWWIVAVLVGLLVSAGVLVGALLTMGEDDGSDVGQPRNERTVSTVSISVTGLSSR